MKKTLLSLFAFALSLGMSAQSILPFNGSVMRNENATAKTVVKAAPMKADLAENQRRAGFYITDELSDEGAGIPGYTSGSCKAGSLITSDILDQFEGNKIIAIRFGLTQPIGSTNLFALPIVGNRIGDEIFSKSVASTVAGWNYVTLDEPITITKNSNYIFGFDYTQSTKNDGQYYDDECFPLSVVETNYDGNGSPFLIYANIPTNVGGQGEGWYGFSDALSIQLIVEGDFPDYTASASNFRTFTGKRDVVNTVDISFLNSSKEAISNLDYVVSVDGTAAAEQHVDLSSPVARNTYGSFTANIPAISEFGYHNVTVELTKLNGGINAESNRTASGKVGIASEAYNRNLVIEEFTTEVCPNCPRVAGYLHTALSKADASRVFAVCHHTGYYTDWLTGTWDNNITSLIFGGTGQAFAPAVTYNRNEYFVENDKQKMGLVGLPQSAAVITATINAALSQQADATITSLEAIPNADGSNVTVTVKGKCNEAYDKDAARITFYITEDNIKARSQSGATGTFYHNHVIRANNDSWGESVKWEGNEFTATYSATLKAAWVKDQMNIVAFLNKYNSKDYSDNVIENSIGVTYKDATAGISNAIMDNANAKEVARYTLDGTKVSAPVKGLNIVKMNDGRIVKVMVK